MNEQQVKRISRQQKASNKRNGKLQQVQKHYRDKAKQSEEEKFKKLKLVINLSSDNTNKKLAREYVGPINDQDITGVFKEGKTAKEKLSDFLHLC